MGKNDVTIVFVDADGWFLLHPDSNNKAKMIKTDLPIKRSIRSFPMSISFQRRNIRSEELKIIHRFQKKVIHKTSTDFGIKIIQRIIRQRFKWITGKRQAEKASTGFAKKRIQKIGHRLAQISTDFQRKDKEKEIKKIIRRLRRFAQISRGKRKN
jgi:hypothetical protein